jgi:hypothetical protein
MEFNRRKLLMPLAGMPLLAQRIPVRAPVSIPGLANVKEYGATGDGVTDDSAAIQAAVNACFGSPEAPHGTNYFLNQVLYFPPGNYKTSAPINFTKLQGARILGAGRFVTTIENSIPGSYVFATNGAGYCHFEGFRLRGAPGTTLFDLNWDGTPGGAALQSNTFQDIFFDSGSIGINIGSSGFMGSENLFLNCFWILNAKAGLVTSNYNALQNSVVGGNFQTCGTGIWVGVGSVTSVHSVGFQQSVNYDILTSGSVGNAMCITGCRSESSNFIQTVQDFEIDGCLHTAPGSEGDFLYSLGGSGVVSACTSNYGRIHAKYSARLRLQECTFKRSDWLSVDQLWPANNKTGLIQGVLELENILIATGQNGSNVQQIFRQRITATPNPVNPDYSLPVIQNYVLQ